MQGAPRRRLGGSPKDAGFLPLCVAAVMSLAICNAGCGDSEGDDAGIGDGGVSARDFGFLRPDADSADAVVRDGTLNADADVRDAGTTDLRPDVGRDAASPFDGGDICTNGPRKPPPPGSLNIINGTRQPTSVSLSPAQAMAVVGIAPDVFSSADCTGTLIAERVVLTAAHCTEGLVASDLNILFGEDDFNPVFEVRVTQITEHPIEDLTLLTLASNPATQLAVQPIPIFRGTLNGSHVGRQVEAAGYGDTGDANTGRFFVSVPIEAVDPDTFDVNGGGLRGLCFGDSGGPAMMLAPEGDVRVIGALSEGSAACAERDTFVRVDALRTFIETVTGPTPGQDPDPCASLGTYGACDGQRLTWCDQGVIQERDCAACGESCLYLGARIGFDCHPDPLYCGELDFLGWCNGNVSEWCNELNQRESYDCDDEGAVCGFVDSESGYYCL